MEIIVIKKIAVAQNLNKLKKKSSSGKKNELLLSMNCISIKH